MKDENFIDNLPYIFISLALFYHLPTFIVHKNLSSPETYKETYFSVLHSFSK